MSFLCAGRLPGNTQSHSRGQSLPADSSWDPNCEELHAAGQGESTLCSPTGIKNKPAPFQGKLRPTAETWSVPAGGWTLSMDQQLNWRKKSRLWQQRYLEGNTTADTLSSACNSQSSFLLLPQHAFEQHSVHPFCRSRQEIICHHTKRWTLLST